MHGGSWDMLELIIWMLVLTQEYTFWYLHVFLYLPREVLTVRSVWPWMSHTQGHDMCQRKRYGKKEQVSGRVDEIKKGVR